MPSTCPHSVAQPGEERARHEPAAGPIAAAGGSPPRRLGGSHLDARSDKSEGNAVHTSRVASARKKSVPSGVSQSACCTLATSARRQGWRLPMWALRSGTSISSRPRTREGASNAACRPAMQPPARGQGRGGQSRGQGRASLTVKEEPMEARARSAALLSEPQSTGSCLLTASWSWRVGP